MSKITEASREHIADENFAFPKERKEPIHDAAHVRNAIARFKQVQGVSDSERDAAWKRIKSAAKKHKVELNEGDWRACASASRSKKLDGLSGWIAERIGFAYPNSATGSP